MLCYALSSKYLQDAASMLNDWMALLEEQGDAFRPFDATEKAEVSVKK